MFFTYKNFNLNYNYLVNYKYIFGTLAGLFIFLFNNFKYTNIFLIDSIVFDHFKQGLFFGMIVAIALATIMAFLPFVLTKKTLYLDKIAGFECGFEPFDEARSEFYIKFYHVAALFLLFEIELLLLFPFAIIYVNSLKFLLKKLLFWSFFFFLVCIFLSLFLEWNKNILDWE